MRHGIFIATFALFASVAHAEDDFLGGIGAIVDAGAPIAVAGIQADSDKAIGKINADAAVKMTQITADTTKYIANDQSTVALYQAQTAAMVNNENQKAVTERLAMQLSALADARHGAEAAEQQKLMIEQQYNNQRIELAKQEAANAIAIAKQQLNLQVMISGLAGAGAFGYGGGSRLTLGNGVLGGSSAVAVATPTPGPDNQRAGDSSTNATATRVPPPRSPQTIALSKKPIPRQVGPRSGRLPTRLLASVGGAPSARGASVRSLGAQPLSGVRGAIAQNSLVRGSFSPPGRVASVAPSVASRVSALAGRSHANGEARASTTVSGGEESEVADLVSSRHVRTDSAAD